MIFRRYPTPKLFTGPISAVAAARNFSFPADLRRRLLAEGGRWVPWRELFDAGGSKGPVNIGFGKLETTTRSLDGPSQMVGDPFLFG